MQIEHLLANHDHEVCAGFTDHHFHSDDVKCELSKFNFNIVAYVPTLIWAKQVPHINADYSSRFKSLISSKKVSSKQLRAPPILV